MALAALNFDPGNPIPVMIAAFIGYAGISEARHVDVMESVRGLTVGQVMIRSDLALPMDTPLSEISAHWRNITAPAMPVISMVGTVVGMLSLREVAAAVEKGVDVATTAGQLIDHDLSAETASASESLESVLMRLGKQQRQIPVVDGGGFLVGVLDLDTMLIRRALSVRDVQAIPEETLPRFDQVT